MVSVVWLDWIGITYLQSLLTFILFWCLNCFVVICNLSLSKEECRQVMVKEAFIFDIVEVKNKKKNEEKRAKIVNEKLNRLFEHKELLVEKLEA